jgi:hypothetical protein
MNEAALAIASDIRRRRAMAGGDHTTSSPAGGPATPTARRAADLELVNGMLLALALAIGKPGDVQAAEDLIGQAADADRPGSEETGAVVAWAESLGVRPEDLDDLVHDLISQQASSINNGGLHDQIAFLVETCGPRQARSLIGECQAGLQEAIADLRGSMVLGYDNDDINRILGRISDASGVQIVCVWEIYDDRGVGGNSEFYVLEHTGRLRELTGDLWPWLGHDPEDPDTPASPGFPGSWVGGPADLTLRQLAYHDGLRNYAERDLLSSCPPAAEEGEDTGQP